MSSNSLSTLIEFISQRWHSHWPGCIRTIFFKRFLPFSALPVYDILSNRLHLFSRYSPIALEQSIEFIRDAMAASEEQQLKELQKAREEEGREGYYSPKNLSAICPKQASVKNLVGVIGPASSTVTIQVILWFSPILSLSLSLLNFNGRLRNIDKTLWVNNEFQAVRLDAFDKHTNWILNEAISLSSRRCRRIFNYLHWWICFSSGCWFGILAGEF